MATVISSVPARLGVWRSIGRHVGFQRSAKHALVLSAAIPALAGAALAQQGPATPDDEIVVIGTPGGAGVDRQGASFAITTIAPEAIEKFSPKSTADLLKAIPGV